ncbi:MAG TPA: LCP family protein [Trebonia sp.]|jgi:LCP family protein required for cell wall assembly|nr:LCP family protein [Trebonia sp.]
MRSAFSKVARWLRHWPRRKILIWGSGSLALLLVAVTGTGYVMLKHFNANLQQDDIRGLLGAQPVNLHPQAENIMVLGSDSRQGLSKAYGSGLVTDQSDTLMIIHIPADRKWAEVMSIPRDSWVNIPACEMGDGQMSAPTQFKINEAFAIGNLDGNHTALGLACTVKTVEQDTGIYINHFIAVNFTGFENMVAALGGVYECNPTPINDPNSNLHLAAGTHLLTPAQALGYVRARYTLGDGSDLERIGRQQAFMSSLVSRVKSELLDPIAIYRFLDAATKSLTIDSQLGGITGLYNLGESLRGIPSSKIAFFTVPNFPRGDVVPGDTANVLWTQPEDNQIFASFRNDVPASSTLFAPAASGTKTSVAAGLAADGQHLESAASTPSSTLSSNASSTPTATPSAQPTRTTSPASTHPAIQARTGNQSICAG